MIPNYTSSESNGRLPVAVHNDQIDHLSPEYGGTRSNVAMEELASLMLTMEIEDKGEPSFTISSRKSTSATLGDPGIDTRDPQHASDPPLRSFGAHSETREQLVTCFMESFNKFHQVLDLDETVSIGLQEPMECALDEQFRSCAILAVSASLSSIPNAAQLESKYASFAESIVLRCIREQPSDLVVQGLSLLSWREMQLGNDSMAYNYICQ
jgi:hypothetical protein